MALAHCILGKFLGVVCHCFPPPLDVPTFAARCRKDARDPSSEHKMCILIFSTTFVWNISRCKKNCARCYVKCTWVLVWSTGCCCSQILMKLVVCRQIFGGGGKLLRYQISFGAVLSMRTDRHDEANIQSLFVTMRSRLKRTGIPLRPWKYGTYFHEI